MRWNAPSTRHLLRLNSEPIDAVFQPHAGSAPAYTVFADRTLIKPALNTPSTLDQLAECFGVGARKLDRHGEAFLAAITRERRIFALGSGDLNLELRELET